MKQMLPVFLVLTFAACQQQPGGATQAVKDSVVTVSAAPAATATVSPTDTVTIGGRLFRFTDIGQSEFDAVPALVPDTSEAVNLARVPSRVQRSGDSLIFSLENGGQKILVNNHSDNDDYAQFIFQAYLPETQHWLVLHNGYEWFSYDLVSARDGEVIQTIGVPQFSPDKKYFIASNADLVAQFTDNGFELFEVRKDGPVEIHSGMLDNWGPVIIKWKDANTLVGEIKTVNEQMEETTRFVKFFLSGK
ncbi:hypothetical protein EGT74_25120 [Chitinophaga lutea]|uniref:Uncharacterized protein n=1 Tax=Chitinophaga lutea TaxID=2488634 RepID=A0A3N4PDZ5_9BACT|nr:hypothetical protein [Chitinophaga lutea]RPE05658.1 hypothetical protein EGT74_25120 [Chitinophaga lutea]